MARVHVVTDSTASLPPEWAATHQVEVVPLQVFFANESFRDGVDLSSHDFYRRLKEAKDLPRTSQPSAGEFAEVYARLGADGSSIVSVHISGALSGTVASAQMAQNMRPELRISVVDTRTTSMGLGFAVLRAAEAAEAGRSHEEVEAIAQRTAETSRLYFVVDTLEYLHKGGRIGGAAALLGSLLSVKPMLTVREGRVEPLDKVRTKSKAVERMTGRIGDELAAGGELHLAVLHANTLAEAQELAARLTSRFAPVETLIGDVGPVIATHTGPGMLGAAFYIDR